MIDSPIDYAKQNLSTSYSSVSGSDRIYQHFNYYNSQNNTNRTRSYYIKIDMGSDCAFVSSDMVCGLPCNSVNTCLEYYTEDVCVSPSYITNFIYTNPLLISYECIKPAPVECQFGSDCEEIIANNTDAPIIYIGIKGDKGEKGDIGLTGEKGEQGDAFQFSDFTNDQLALLKGADGDSYDDSNLVQGIQNNTVDISSLFIETYLL